MKLQTELGSTPCWHPDNSAGIVPKLRADPSRHGCGSLPNPYREVRVLWQKPPSYVVGWQPPAREIK